jgi:hypothetical protein
MAEEKKSYKEEMAGLERRRIRGVQKVLDGVSRSGEGVRCYRGCS